MTQLPLDAMQPGPSDPDSEARRAISEALDENMFVEASAGTGKTRALVDRIVALVLKGVPIDQIAAITFTERAAGELRERVRDGLEDAVARGMDETAAARAALESLDRAQISTIHAFCQAILRTYAVEAGVDPDFTVQDEVMTERRMEERWRLYLEELGNDEQARVDVDRLLSLGLRVDELQKLALELASRGEVADLLADRPHDTNDPPWPDLDATLRDLRGLEADRVAADDKLAQRILGVIWLLEEILQEPGAREELLAAGAAALTVGHRGNSGNWGGRRNQALDVVSETQERLDSLLGSLRASALAAVLPRIVEFVKRDEATRGREGKLTFDDLILRSRRLLDESKDAAASLRSRFRVLLIDEFQDTDPMQIRIAKVFATDPRTGRLEPGRLFLVGDPKQSIYRFRRADMATYASTRVTMNASAAQMPQLQQNRRSQRVVVDWVNSIFGRLIGEGDNPHIQPPYAAIETHRTPRLQGPGVATFGYQQDVNARQTRVIEAEEVAAVCLKVVKEKWQVAARTGEVREARFRDIAILMPRRTGLTALERALAESGVPYRVEGGSLIYRTQEVRDLINILTALDNSADEIAIVAALRSPGFACSDVDLARHRARGGRFGYERVDFVTSGPVADGLRTLRELHGIRHESSLAAVVERVALQCGLVETGILDRGDRNSFRRVRFMIERARAFEASGPESVRAFVQWLEQQSEAAMLDNEGAGLDDDEDAVRVQTIHGAKGLEFPIVVMAGTAAFVNVGIPPVYTTDFAGERVAICVGGKGENRRFTLGPFDELNSLERQHADAEFDRLLYVAATRARDHLVISLHHPKKAKDTAAQKLMSAGASDTHKLAVSRVGQRSAVSQLAALRVDLPVGVTEENFESGRAALLVKAKKVSYTSATALAPKQEEKEEATDETEPWARGRGGTRLGRAVHAAIQSVPLDADDRTIESSAKAQAVAQAIPHREKEVVRLVRWVVRESEAWKRARGAMRAMREVPFALQSDGIVLEGFVDLVIQTDEGIEIVDWKTDQISAGDVEKRLAEYLLQAGLYVHGLESATGMKVRAVTYVFAHAKVEASPGEPGALANAARERLSTAAVKAL